MVDREAAQRDVSPRPVASSGAEAAAGAGGAPFADPVDVLDSSTAGARVIRGGVFRIAAYAASVLLSVVAAALMIRHLGVDDWGRYVTVSSLVTIVTGLGELGLSNLGIREFATLEGAQRKRLVQNLLGIRLALTIVGIAGAVVFTAVASYPGAVVAGTALAGAGIVLTVFQQTAGIPLAAGLRFGWISALDVLRQVLTVALVAVLVAAGAGLLPFFVLTIIVSLAILALTVAVVGRGAPVIPLGERREWRRILQMTVAYAAAAAVGTLYVSITVLVTSLVGTAAETGLYGASFRIFAVVGNIPVLLVGTAFPVLSRAARDDRTRLQYAAGRVWEICLLLGVGTALVIAASAPFTLRVVAGSDFEQAVPVLQIQAAALVGGFVAVALAHVLLSLRRHRELLIANAIALGAALVLTAVLVPPYGAKGAAVATVAGEFGVASAYLVALLRAGLRLPWRTLPAVVASVAAASALALVPGLDSVGLAVAAAAVYTALVFVLRAVPEEVTEALAGLRPRH